MEDRQARHIGEIIKEHDFPAEFRIVPKSPPEHNIISQVAKLLRRIVSSLLDMLAAIGWCLSLPFINWKSRG